MSRAEGWVSYHPVPQLPGIEVLRAEESLRDWRWYHTAYSVCTPLRFLGSAQYRYRGRVRSAAGNHQLIMEPGEVHTSRLQTAPATFRVLFVPQRILADAWAELGYGRGLPHFSGEPVQRAALLRKFRRLHESLESRAATRLEIDSRFSGCIDELLKDAIRTRTTARARDVLPPPRVRELQDYLEAHLTEAVSLDRLARLVGLSRFHVARDFTKVTGVAPHAYQILLRVARARALLTAGASIAEAAGQSGFVDPSHLGRHFKRITGTTPGLYPRGPARRARSGRPRVAPAAMGWSRSNA